MRSRADRLFDPRALEGCDDDDDLVVGTDGLVVRPVAPHSAEKARMVRNDLGTVARAMHKKPWPIHYIELYAGPGWLRTKSDGLILPGSPMEALSIEKPFGRYVFGDFDDECADALRERVRREHPTADARVLCGDANDRAHLDRVCALVDPTALVLAYLDPEKHNLHLSTIDFLTRRFDHIDVLINLPVSTIHRVLGLARRQLEIGEAARAEANLQDVRLALGHPDPLALLGEVDLRGTDAIRDCYDEQLRSMGLEHIARRTVCQNGTARELYDIVLASRHPMAVRLWDRANKRPANPQLSLLDAVS